MKHVFVETNWVVAYAAPDYHKAISPQADELLKRAAGGEFRLELPAICIAESRRAIQTRYAPRAEADVIRTFLRWAKTEGYIREEHRQTALDAVSRMENGIRNDLSRLNARLDLLQKTPGLIVFDLEQEAALRCTELSFENIDLQPFDQMILAAILVRGKQLVRQEAAELCFCELDSHLQPWGGSGMVKESLKRLYDEAEIWVYGDFQVQTPQRPAAWP